MRRRPRSVVGKSSLSKREGGIQRTQRIEISQRNGDVVKPETEFELIKKERINFLQTHRNLIALPFEKSKVKSTSVQHYSRRKVVLPNCYQVKKSNNQIEDELQGKLKLDLSKLNESVVQETQSARLCNYEGRYRRRETPAGPGKIFEALKGNKRESCSARGQRDPQRHQALRWIKNDASWKGPVRPTTCRSWNLRDNEKTRPHPYWVSREHRARVERSKKNQLHMDQFAKKRCQDDLSIIVSRYMSKIEQRKDYDKRVEAAYTATVRSPRKRKVPGPRTLWPRKNVFESSLNLTHELPEK